MIRLRALLVLGLLSGWGVSGSQAQITCTDTAKHFFPVEPGASWTYHYDFDTAAHVERSVGDTAVRAGVVYRIYRYSPQFEVLIRSDSLGRVWKYFPYLASEYVWFDFTRNDGTAYWCPGDWGEFFTVSVNKCIPCSSEAGTFDNCLQLYFNDPRLAHEDIIYTFAPGAGIVREQRSGWYTYILDALLLTAEGRENTPPAAFHLRQNYPNPFNPTSTIAYSIPTAGRVTVKIFDILGRLVETLLDERMEAGEHTLVWDAAGYPGGNYFCRLTVGFSTETRKMVLLR